MAEGDNGTEIVIPLSLETTQFTEQLAETQTLADEAFSRGMATAIDKAQQRIDALTAAQERLNVVIANNRTVIDELESRRASADEAETARIDQQIAALQRLNQQHEVEIQTNEAKKVQIGANSLAMLAATDAERAAIQAGVQAQLISIQTLKDQDTAYNRVRDTAVASQEAIKAQLDAVLAKQGQVQASIVQQGEAYEAIAANRSNQPEGEQAQVDAVLASLQRVINARSNENLVLDQKRVRLEGEQQLQAATSDAERAAIQATTDARLRQLTVELDQQRVNQGVRDTWTAASERQREAIAKVTADEQRLTQIIQEQQAAVQSMRGQRQNAPTGQQPNVDSELAARQRVIDQRIQELAIVQRKRVAMEAEAALSAATSDQEREQIRSVADTQLRTIQLQADEQRAVSRTRDVYNQSLTQTSRQVEDLTRRQSQNTTVLEANAARVRDLQVARSTASAEERQTIDNEIDSLQRTSAQRENDNLRIREKLTLIGQQTALAQASSDEERAAIQQVTNARLAELSIERDQAAAQRTVNETTEAGIPIVGQFVSMFAGLGGAMFALQSIKQVLQEDQQIMAEIVAAGKTLRDQAGSQYDVSKGFNAEMGLYTADDEAKGTASLNQIAQQFTLPQQVVGQTGSALAAVLRREGVGDVNSQQFRELVGNAGLFVNKGIEAPNVSYFLQQQLRRNPQLTGTQLNQELSDLLRDANGSPQLANEGLSILSQDAERFRAAGLTDRDQLQLFRRSAQVAPAQEVPGLLRQYGQGLDRLLGLRRPDMIELFEKVNSLTPLQESVVKEMSQGATTPQQMAAIVRQIERMRRPGQGLPDLDKVFEQGVSTGQIDIPQFNTAVASMDANQRQIVAREVAGPRNVVAMGSLLDYRAGRAAYGAPLMPVPSSPVEQTRVAEEQAAYQASVRTPPVPEEAVFSEELDKETTYVERNKDQLLDFYQRHPSFGHSLGMDFTGSIADQKEIAAARVLTRRLVDLGRLRQQMVEGKVRFTPQQSQQLQSSINDMLALLSPNGEQSDALQALAAGSVSHIDPDTGKDVTTTASQALAQYDQNPEQFLRTNVNTNVVSTTDDSITDDRKAGAVIRSSNAAVQSIQQGQVTPQRQTPTVQGPPRPIPSTTPATTPTTRPAPTPYREPTTDREVGGTTPIPQPTTKPSGPPVSINYHVRQTIYGYSSDAVGAPAQFDNNYG